jgi:hypothetical protein
MWSVSTGAGSGVPAAGQGVVDLVGQDRGQLAQ